MNKKGKVYTKPPLGIMPRWLFDEFCPNLSQEDIKLRIKNINEAINRFRKHQKQIPETWHEELKDLEQQLL